ATTRISRGPLKGDSRRFANGAPGGISMRQAADDCNATITRRTIAAPARSARTPRWLRMRPQARNERSRCAPHFPHRRHHRSDHWRPKFGATVRSRHNDEEFLKTGPFPHAVFALLRVHSGASATRLSPVDSTPGCDAVHRPARCDLLFREPDTA